MYNSILVHNFAYYNGLLYSSDNRTIIIALQDIYTELCRGHILRRCDRTVLEQRLKYLIDNSTDEVVRRNAYRICIFSYNELLANACLKRLTSEINIENRLAIIAVLSQIYSEDRFNTVIKNDSHGLSFEQIALAMSLLPKNRSKFLSSKLINKQFQTNDVVSLSWLGLIASYNNAQNIDNDNVVTHELISELSNHDNSWVQKYAISSFNSKKHFKVSDLQLDYKNSFNMKFQPKKWILTIIWKDEKFIKKNFDFIEEILNPNHLFGLTCDKRVREGIARGIANYKYDNLLAPLIIQWLSYETSESVIKLLELYIIKYKYKNNDFKDIVEHEISSTTNNSRRLIMFCKNVYSNNNGIQVIGDKNIVSNEIYTPIIFTEDELSDIHKLSGSIVAINCEKIKESEKLELTSILCKIIESSKDHQPQKTSEHISRLKQFFTTIPKIAQEFIIQLSASYLSAITLSKLGLS